MWGKITEDKIDRCWSLVLYKKWIWSLVIIKILLNYSLPIKSLVTVFLFVAMSVELVFNLSVTYHHGNYSHYYFYNITTNWKSLDFWACVVKEEAIGWHPSICPECDNRVSDGRISWSVHLNACFIMVGWDHATCQQPNLHSVVADSSSWSFATPPRSLISPSLPTFSSQSQSTKQLRSLFLCSNSGDSCWVKPWLLVFQLSEPSMPN